MQKGKIRYYLSEAGRKASLLTGGDGKQEQVVEADITPALLALANVGADGIPILSVTNPRKGEDLLVKSVRGGKPYLGTTSTDTFLEFDFPQTAEQLVVFETARRAGVAAKEAALQPELERMTADWQARKRAEEEEAAAKRAVEEAAANERREKAEAEREGRAAEKAAWVAEHGSDYLKRAVNLGYDCQRQYVTERAAAELPGFTLDFDGNAEWKSRACPSEEALIEVSALIEAGYKACVVWLVNPVRELEYGEFYDEREAIIVDDYLGRYILVKEF